jgi:predicted ArsR family transcriptional regulator
VSVAAVENLLKESRCAIIELLKAHGAMSVEQLASALAVSKVCVRRHLALLESDGLIRYEVEHRDRGRPRYLYHLTEKAACLFPRSYDEFAKEVLVQVEQAFGERGLLRVLAGRADEMIAQLKQEFAGLGFDERVKRLAQIISEKGFLAEVRRLRDGSYRLRQRNCPTESVAVAHPEVCQQELRVYGEALGCEVYRECRIADGAPMCEYHILPPARRALRVLRQPSHYSRGSTR